MRILLKLAVGVLFLGLSQKGMSDPKQVVEEILAHADVKINGDRPFDIKVYDDRFYTRVLESGSLGFGESYMEGWWDSPSLDECMSHILRANLQNAIQPTWAMRWEVVKAKLTNLQSKARSSKVVDEHYELGDRLYELMLGGTLAYTCAYWKDAATLDEAQKAKFDLVAKKVGLKKGMRVLDVGCGWGGFSKHIAENYGVEVVAVNLSAKQVAYAKKICQGLPVDVRCQDYRDLQCEPKSFDRVISIGLMEHVGPKNYRGYMELCHRYLKDDGLALIHTIGRDTTADTLDPWINRYIFPHGHLPSVTQFGAAIEGLFVMEDWHNMSANYDDTLMAWYHNFDQSWAEVKSDYPDPFYRMWKYYLLSCAGGFRARTLQLWQVVLSKKGVIGGYESVR